MTAVVIQASYRLQRAANLNWQRSQRLHALSRTDPLTGLPNRRQFAEDSASRPADGDTGVRAIVMIDVDHLKQFNDAFGHFAGDGCLDQIADVLTQSARAVPARIYRLGGEEFAAIITGDTASTVADRARQLVAAVEEAQIESPVPGWPVTVSAGLAVADASEDLSSAMSRADDALYEAKRTGRNRLVVAECGPAGAGDRS